MLIDTHCHLNNESFADQVEAALEKAKSVGVERFFVVGWDLESSKKAIKLAEDHKEIYAIVGIHPTDVIKLELSALDEIEQLLTHPKVAAYGEIGLDYHWVTDPAEREKQKLFFIAQINLANKYRLPISVHMRDAVQDTYEILKNNPVDAGGIMHCYSGSVEMMEKFVALGMYISLAGPVTFKNARVPKEVAIKVPVEKLLIETDSPYLAPHPHRGKQNEPALLPLIAAQIAQLRGVSAEEIATITSRNALEAFRVEHNG